ncbi:hypothetical protein HKX48_005770 [Thoreauomyces humboldtii]|nr:hypothetical protein HKX48_005770 [Thoreauomyces humboldtii]
MGGSGGALGGGAKQLPHVVVVEGLDFASGAVHGALMEVIERGQVTDRNTVYPCPTPFLIIGLTSNSPQRRQSMPPQLLERFFLCHTLSSTLNRCVVTYPGKVPLLRFEDLAQLASTTLGTLHVEQDILYYMRNLITALRNHPGVSTGVSPKSGTDLALACRVLALLSGTGAVMPDHVALMIDKVVAHRLFPVHFSVYVSPDARQALQRLTCVDIVADVVGCIPAPV